jgi:hypothetical protein
MYGDAAAHVHLYAISGGSRVLESDSAFMFHPASPLDVDGFELELESGLGDDVVYMPMEIIDSGSIDVNSSVGTLLDGLVEGNYYAIEGTGGPWYWAYFAPWNDYAWRNYHVNIGTGGGVQGGWGRDGNGGTDGIALNGNGVYGERIGDTLYGRGYFYYAAGDRYALTPEGGGYANRIGSIGFRLRNARVDGRRIELGAIYIKNVCPAG